MTEKLPLYVKVHPVTGDVRCPNDNEFVNKRCWSCGWIRVDTTADLDDEDDGSDYFRALDRHDKQ